MAISSRSILFIWIVIAAASSPATGSCVLDSDFGFTLNCGFKQSGLFRVRNLGGVKGYFGVGFSVGDELGFKQSLSNVEGNRRRSTQGAAVGSTQNDARTIASQRTTLLATPLVQTPIQSLYAQRSIPTQQISILPPFKPIPLSSHPSRRITPSNSSAIAQGGAVAAAVASSQGSRRRSPSPSADVSASVIRTVKAPTLVAVPVGTTTRVVPAFQALPQTSISRTSDAGDDFRSSLGDFIKMPTRGFTLNAVAPPSSDSAKPSGIKSDSLSTRTLASSDSVAVKPNTASKLTPSSIGQSVEAIAKASNVSVQTVATAIAAKLRRRQQALEQAANDANADAAAASHLLNSGVKKQQPKPSALVSSRGRVMNAPREYYPVGYDKDFDDGFAARVDLPDTSFSCGHQKHFPGLYADEDLGCMVFHVCALTDDGLIMKSFLCPESTLFDQTILKCNWWFYVDCKASRKLYDSNIPVSKSYQLMKALAFFSSYKS